MRGSQHGAQQAQRVRHASVREVTTNEIRAAVVDLPSGAEGCGGVLPSVAAEPPQPIDNVSIARIGAAEYARRVEVIERHRANGPASWKAIGAELGMSADRIWRWWANQQARARGEKLPHTRVRSQPGELRLKPGQFRMECMTCKTPFASWSKSANRLCPTHRLAGSESPYACDYVTTGRQVRAVRS